MSGILRGMKIVFNVFFTLILFLFITNYLIIKPMNRSDGGQILPEGINIGSFQLDGAEVVYDTNSKEGTQAVPASEGSISKERLEVLNRAKAMIDVKWTPSTNLIDKHGPYIFVKGKTYCGIPYSMGSYQAASAEDFLSKIKGSKTLYGNDCSGFVSAAWGISRQTTLTLYEAVKQGSKVDGKAVNEISWQDLKPGDALLLDNGKGKGHVVLFVSRDSKDGDKLNIYEQNVATIFSKEPIPVARQTIRSVEKLKKEGYIPIRLSTLAS